eukprot:m.1229406 g.1229406  ORF g.1229406 m.1229406 type:complete len:177 (-) comp24652_c1_seq1:3736-4266(-)
MHLSLSKHRDNLGDITAKVTSQTITASLVGTALGIAVSHWTGGSSSDVLAVFVPLSAGVLYTTYRSCALIALDTLSVQRAERVLHRTLHPRHGSLPEGGGVVPSPEDISQEEVFAASYASVFATPLVINAPLHDTAIVRRLAPRDSESIWAPGSSPRRIRLHPPMLFPRQQHLHVL